MGRIDFRPYGGNAMRMQERTFTARLIFCIVLILLVFSGIAAAQKKKTGGGVIELEEITIEGRIQKPNAFYILERQGLGFEIMDLNTSFVDQIAEPVKNEPF